MSDLTDQPTGQPSPPVATQVDEVQGIFPSDAALQDAMAKLALVGFDRADFSLPTASPTRAEATPELGAAPPTTAEDQAQLRTMATSMAGAVGAMAAAGVVVATGGVAAAVLGAAALAGAGAAGVTHVASSAADGVQHDERQAEAAQGKLVLAVRLSHPVDQAKAEAAMREAGASRVAAVARSPDGHIVPIA